VTDLSATFERRRKNIEWGPAPPPVFVDVSWHDRAACRGVNTDLFFPAKGQPASPAKAVCEGCEVRVECLDFAMVTGQYHGIWGGLSERQRRKLRSAQEAGD